MFSQPPPRKQSIARVVKEEEEEEEEGKVVEKIEKSSPADTPIYEFGRLISGGMIGSTYLVRLKSSKGPAHFCCIKRMRGKPMAEKSLFGSIRRELLILK